MNQVYIACVGEKYYHHTAVYSQCDTPVSQANRFSRLFQSLVGEEGTVW